MPERPTIGARSAVPRHVPRGLGARSYFQYGLELSEQGFDAPALVVFERVARADPSAIAFYNLGTLYMKTWQGGRREGGVRARACSSRPTTRTRNNSLGALLAQSGDLPGAIAHFRAAAGGEGRRFADAMNNLGYALFQTGQRRRGHELYQKALALQPHFPEALNNVGIFYGSSAISSAPSLLPAGSRAAPHLRRSRQQPRARAGRARRARPRRSRCCAGC